MTILTTKPSGKAKGANTTAKVSAAVALISTADCAHGLLTAACSKTDLRRYGVPATPGVDFAQSLNEGAYAGLARKYAVLLSKAAMAHEDRARAVHALAFLQG